MYLNTDYISYLGFPMSLDLENPLSFYNLSSPLILQLHIFRLFKKKKKKSVLLFGFCLFFKFYFIINYEKKKKALFYCESART